MGTFASSARALVMALLCLFFAAGHAQADDVKKVVLQISDGSPDKQTLVLNVANNLVKYYDGNVEVEIVAFGPGLRLLFDDNSNRVRVQGLSANGVRFAACQNTMKKMTKALGHEPKLVSYATPVGAGVARILDLTAQGYTLVRP
jgi:intracellular sulfur oxidation DsrE/DsrF family protein